MRYPPERAIPLVVGCSRCGEHLVATADLGGSMVVDDDRVVLELQVEPHRCSPDFMVKSGLFTQAEVDEMFG